MAHISTLNPQDRLCLDAATLEEVHSVSAYLSATAPAVTYLDV